MGASCVLNMLVLYIYSLTDRIIRLIRDKVINRGYISHRRYGESPLHTLAIVWCMDKPHYIPKIPLQINGLLSFAYDRRFLNLSALKPMITAPMMKRASIWGHKTEIPAPLRNIPRTITRKYLRGFA